MTNTHINVEEDQGTMVRSADFVEDEDAAINAMSVTATGGGQ